VGGRADQGAGSGQGATGAGAAARPAAGADAGDARGCIDGARCDARSRRSGGCDRRRGGAPAGGALRRPHNRNRRPRRPQRSGCGGGKDPRRGRMSRHADPARRHPLVTSAEITQLLAAHRPAPAFTIAPSRDERGSNAIICSPPDAVPLRFGEDSFFPHLRAAEACGIRPTVLRLPGIALDVDTPEDLAALTLVRAATRAHALLDLQRAAAVIGDPWE
jgi:hypothetical protein